MTDAMKRLWANASMYFRTKCCGMSIEDEEAVLERSLLDHQQTYGTISTRGIVRAVFTPTIEKLRTSTIRRLKCDLKPTPVLITEFIDFLSKESDWTWDAEVPGVPVETNWPVETPRAAPGTPTEPLLGSTRPDPPRRELSQPQQTPPQSSAPQPQERVSKRKVTAEEVARNENKDKRTVRMGLIVVGLVLLAVLWATPTLTPGPKLAILVFATAFIAIGIAMFNRTAGFIAAVAAAVVLVLAGTYFWNNRNVKVEKVTTTNTTTTTTSPAPAPAPQPVPPPPVVTIVDQAATLAAKDAKATADAANREIKRLEDRIRSLERRPRTVVVARPAVSSLTPIDLYCLAGQVASVNASGTRADCRGRANLSPGLTPRKTTVYLNCKKAIPWVKENRTAVWCQPT